MCRGASFGCGGVVVPIAPANGPGGPEATRQVMVGERSWHVGGESSPTSLPCSCRWGAVVLRPPERSRASSPAAVSVHTVLPTALDQTLPGAGCALWLRGARRVGR